MKTANAEFLKKYPTDEAQIDYYTGLAKEVFTEFKIDGSFKTEGIRKNVATWYANKKKQMELFRKHPYWNEEAKAIIFTQTEKRDINYRYAAETLYHLGEYLYDHGYRHYDLIDSLRIVFDDIDNENEWQSQISENFLMKLNNILDEELPTKIMAIMKVGTKITKLVRKYCEHLGVTSLVDDHEPDDHDYRSFEKYFAKFADCLSELTINKLTVISLHFNDFMLMSNGNSWLTCHFINSHNIFHKNSSHVDGAYKQGCLSYALDEPSLILYTLPETYGGSKYYREPKINRMCCQYQDGILITGKCYPENSDKLIEQYRQTLQKVISEAEETPNSWTFSKNVDKIGNFSQTGRDAAHYTDYAREHQKPTISLCRGLFDIDKRLTIGHESYCLHCGKKYRDSYWLQCDAHRKDMVCKHCGRVIEEDEKDVVINDDVYCPDCVFYCDHHKQYELIDGKHGTITTDNGEITICKNAIKNYKVCECGKYVYVYSEKCKNCGLEFEFKSKVVPKEVYEVGDYVLIAKKVSDCKFGVNETMKYHYPNKIAKIKYVDLNYRGGVYHISDRDGGNWSWNWSPNCFAGVVIGATDDMIGKTLEEVIK